MVDTEFLLLVKQGHIGPVGALLPKLLNPMFYSFLVKGEGISPPMEGTKKGKHFTSLPEKVQIFFALTKCLRFVPISGSYFVKLK